MTGTYGPPEEKHSRRVLRGQLLKGKFKSFNSLFHSVYLGLSTPFFFYCQHVCRALSVENVCGETWRQVKTDRTSIKNLQKKIVPQGSHVV